MRKGAACFFSTEGAWNLLNCSVASCPADLTRIFFPPAVQRASAKPEPRVEMQDGTNQDGFRGSWCCRDVKVSSCVVLERVSCPHTSYTPSSMMSSVRSFDCCSTSSLVKTCSRAVSSSRER